MMDRPIASRDAPDSIQPETQMPPGADKHAPHPEHMRHTRKAFEQMGRLKAPGRPLFDRFFDRLLPSLPDSQRLDWGDEADWARLQQEPLRARWLLGVVGVVVVLLLVWAGLAEIDEVVHGEGKVIPAAREQIIRAVDPGQVEKIVVREGEEVAPNQLLLRINSFRYASEAGAGEAQLLSLMAQVARLTALIDKSELVMPEEVLKSRPDLAAQEQETYRSSLDKAKAELFSAQQQLTQREQELKEVQAAHSSAVNGLSLAREELEKNIPLEKTGAVSEVEVLRLKQTVEKFDGDRRQAAERIVRSKAAINEAQSKIQEIESTQRNGWSKDLTNASSELAKVTAGIGVTKDKIKQTELLSPVRGKVKRLLVNTRTGFVQQGQDLIEIVPLETKLLIEAKVKPKDIGFLKEGQQTVVKITAYDFAIYGGLDGKLVEISPNTVTDEKGNMFYLIKVETDKNYVGKDDKKNGISPGMVADVNVLTGRKTVLSYLLKPVLRAKANAMTEK